MHTNWLALTEIAILWSGYLALHSALASLGAKDWIARHFPAALPAYRIAYNALALTLILPLLWWTARQGGPALWTWPNWIDWSATAIAAAGFVWSLRWYDGATFLGLRQWRDRTAPDSEHAAFTISPLHRHVRHPWYGLGSLWLWTRDLNAAWLAVAVVVTVYLVIGSRLEERKLLAFYGEPYQKYRARVPGLIPLPGRALSRADAEMIQSAARQASRR